MPTIAREQVAIDRKLVRDGSYERPEELQSVVEAELQGRQVTEKTAQVCTTCYHVYDYLSQLYQQASLVEDTEPSIKSPSVKSPLESIEEVKETRERVNSEITI